MAVRPVLRMGHPTLRIKAKDVKPEEIRTKAFKKLLQDMVDTMRAEEGVGIAAPQIGESLRVCIIEFGENNPRYKNDTTQGLTYFINPKIKVVDPDVQGYWEGCLSVPALRGWVERPRAVHVTYLNEHGEKKTMDGEGFLATVLQHEFDHLDGTLYIDRVKDTTKLAYLDEFRDHILPLISDDEDLGE